jgi:proteasome accessory factor B
MKAETRPRYHRLRRIVEMVREGGAGGRLPNRSHFRRELEVSARTLARDLDFLRDEERAPIEYDSARHGYRFSDETWELPAVSLSRREVFAFSLARRLLEVFEGTPLAMDMRSTLDKIAESLEGRFPVRLESLTEHVGVLGEARAAVDPGTWESVARAIERRETLRVDYRRFDGRRGEYEIEPYHLLAYQGNWYALARSRASGKVQTFALSRMAAPRATGESFERAAGFDWRAFAREAFGIAHGEKVHRVRLLFAPRVATYIRERVWHASQRLRQRRDGSLEMRIETTGRRELLRWILSWTPDVAVLAPRALRERVVGELTAGLRAASGVRPRPCGAAPAS